MSEPVNERVTVKSFVDKAFSEEENSAAALGEKKLGKYSDIAIKMFHTGVLSPKEKIYPAVGQFATKMLKGLNAYQKLYFVNALNIDMSYVTIIYTLIGIYDVLNNPLMGIAYDHTRTRWGKARPYVFLGAIPYYLSTAIMYSGALFLSGGSSNDPRKIIFVFVMMFIQETFSTIYSIPRDNMLTLQTPNPKDRIQVGLLNQYIGEIGSQLIYLIFLPLMELGNKGYIKMSMPMLFSVLATITCSIGAVGNMAMAVGCKERIALQPEPAPPTKTLFYILKNKYALRNFIAQFSVNWWSDGNYSWDVVTQQEIFGGSIVSFLAYAPYNAVDTLSVALIPRFQKMFKNNNRKALITLRLWDIATYVCMCAIGIPFVDKKWVIAGIYAIFYGLNGLNNGPANVFEAEVEREINDYTEYVTGERADGTFGLLTQLIGKVTAPLNALLTIWLFKWSGYDTTIPMLPWSQNSKVIYQKVFFLWTGIDILPKLIKLIPYFMYDLVGEKRERMYIALNERRALMAQQHSDADTLMEMVETLEDSID